MSDNVSICSHERGVTHAPWTASLCRRLPPTRRRRHAGAGMTESERPPQSSTIPGFIAKWRSSAAAERANKDLFLSDLCRVLGVPGPRPATGDPKRDLFVFEKGVRVSREGAAPTTKKIDLYKHGCFVLEAKQGSEATSGKLGTAKRKTPAWNIAMNAAFGQALEYAKFLDEPPPFIIVTDIGFCFDLYASFDGTTNYRQFPNALAHRIYISELENDQTIVMLRTVFQDPKILDPSRVAVQVTREVAGHLAELTRRLEKAGHAPKTVATFLMRCIFTMFAEDVGLLPGEIFTRELKEHWVKLPKSFPGGLENLWRAMNEGAVFGFFGKLLHFNGGLFLQPAALPLTKGDLEILLEAASCTWAKVEPAIFGTLLERALDEKERHALGAHFTPRAYVERLIRPTLEEPLRSDWDEVQKRVEKLVVANKIADAKNAVRAFMKELSDVRVLDPACGTGNFLYIALDVMKSIEDEALSLLLALEKGQSELCLDAPEVTPRQFLGIEISERAKEIAELVLWIGYLQWHFRSKHRGGKPREPVLKDYKNIECRDAVLAYDSQELAREERTGKPLTRWDGDTMRLHPVTGNEIPDQRFTVPEYVYTNPRSATWPEAHFIVGNPPFLGNKRMRTVLGDGYVDALRKAWPSVPEGADLVMYWWNAAAVSARKGVRRFGLITTNSITQTSNAEVIARQQALEPRISVTFAIPDHPWVDAKTGAAVRIAMTVGSSEGGLPGVVWTVASESRAETAGVPLVELVGASGFIQQDLSVGAKVKTAKSLLAAKGLGGQGVLVLGDGFLLSTSEAQELRTVEPRAARFIRPFRNGRDLMSVSRDLWIIDLFGLKQEEEVRVFPNIYQRLHDTVRPFRNQMRDKSRRERWWLFGRSNGEIRSALTGLKRYIATCRTAKHRVFMFLPGDVLPDTKLVAIALDDAYHLAVLSSRAHTVWALRVGGFLEDRPTYQHADCFGKFPFPEPSDSQRARIRELGEALDMHRKDRQQRAHRLTITDMYNVLEKLRSETELTDNERIVHQRGLVTVLKDVHDNIDAAVFAAYGWPNGLTDEEILGRLVELNSERAKEEQGGMVRWLRPEFQQKEGARGAPSDENATGPGVAKSKPPRGPSVVPARERKTQAKPRRRAK